MQRIKEAVVGSATLRLFKDASVYKGIVIADDQIKARQEGGDAEDVWRRLHDEAAKANPKYVGFNGARNRFLTYFPAGFESPEYGNAERKYKLEAKAKLDKAAPVEDAAAGKIPAAAVLPALGTNLLFPQEQMRARDVLHGPAANDFIRAAAQFALGEGKPALLAMERALKAYDAAKWTVATYLPFLWLPEQHMFLKPTVTKMFAERVAHRFASDYTPRLDFAVYESLLDLAARTEFELRDLQPRDRIDVQSFIWVIGGYQRQPGEPKASRVPRGTKA